ncbi:MAG TPA: hypothetical protein VFV50_02285 [Bdellovibrionales bacterium]|nr:hypothetical protein [Bdellovibrionales bacterium]
MKALVLVLILIGSTQAWARPNYSNSFVPTSLTNLGVTPNGWVAGRCSTCHGAQTSFTSFNTTFGDDFFQTANSMYPGVLIQNGADDLTQAQVQAVIQMLLPTDSDTDTYTNEQELRARSDIADSTSTPASQGGGGGDDPCTVVPDLCQGGSNSSSSTGRIVSADAAYQLNSGCGVQGPSASFRPERDLQTASAPIAGFFFMFALPLLVALIRRRQ